MRFLLRSAGLDRHTFDYFDGYGNGLMEGYLCGGVLGMVITFVIIAVYS
jgi:hypothetical protein